MPMFRTQSAYLTRCSLRWYRHSNWKGRKLSQKSSGAATEIASASLSRLWPEIARLESYVVCKPAVYASTSG